MKRSALQDGEPQNSVIEVKNLTFSYPGASDQSILSIPAWTVRQGERIFLHGPSGSGKTTLLNLLSGLLQPNTGELNILGTDVTSLSHRQRDRFRAEHIGYVFQQFNLIPYLSAIENVALAQYFSNNRAEIKQQDSVSNLLSSLGLNAEQQNSPSAQLSIGQQQRVAIARALINKPEVLIADEPTSALDEQNRNAFLDVLLRLVQENNTTLVFVSHDLSLKAHFGATVALSELNTVTTVVKEVQA